MPELGDLAINLAASVIAGTAVFVWQLLRQRRRRQRRRRFFGLDTRGNCVVYMPRHASSVSALSVHQRDTAAVVEIAAAARECGAEIELILQSPDQRVPQRQLGDDAEFTIGGPEANPRMAAHLETFLPGLTMGSYLDSAELTIRVGGESFDKTPGTAEHVAVAKIVTDDGAPVFALCGQTAISNHAAARYLCREHHTLTRTYGTNGRFCLVLRVVNPWAYGERKVELVADVTEDAFTAPPRPGEVRGTGPEQHTVVADRDGAESSP
ncbi:hypothetical protein [Prauserella alba]|uniref:Secreted protein n=1 Tax=Prauserella alba TaxID=176898 RepID=A0ABP4G492_9PSEU|nr:hypothetical protein [Prauserella alba]MCP2181986.1 hypothetical protein [Prauserella alba]